MCRELFGCERGRFCVPVILTLYHTMWQCIAVENSPFSIVIPDNEPLERTLDRAELKPIRVDCSIHAWMRAYLVVTDHPYSAITNQNGEFSIPKVPQGEWEFRFWHERTDYLTELSTEQGSVTLKRGGWKIPVTTAEHDLGTLTVNASAFVSEE